MYFADRPPRVRSSAAKSVVGALLSSGDFATASREQFLASGSVAQATESAATSARGMERTVPFSRLSSTPMTISRWPPGWSIRPPG